MVVQWLRLCTARGMNLIPGWGAKIGHVMPCSKRKKINKGKLVINMLGVDGEHLCIEKRLPLASGDYSSGMKANTLLRKDNQEYLWGKKFQMINCA